MAMAAIERGDLREYVQELNDLPADILLGRIAFYTITDEGVRHEDVVNWFDELDLNPDFIPAPNRALDAFKKATTGVKESYALSRNRQASLLARDVTSTHEYVRRQITREIRDPRRKVLSYDEVITCTFYRPTHNDQSSSRMNVVINPNNIEPDERTIIQMVANGLEMSFRRNFEYLDGQKIRATVRNYLKSLNGIEIKGSTYFVHASRDNELNRLAEFVNRCGGQCEMNTIPIPNIEKQREFMTKAFEREAAQALREITKEAGELLTQRKSITEAAYAKLQGRLNEVMTNAEEHMFNLQVSQDLTGSAADVAFDAMKALKKKMLEDVIG